jgi:hypothetical protein
MHNTTDSEIRSALRRVVLRRYVRSPNARVVDEVDLKHGAARVDLMVVNEWLHGYEIKSDRDTLSRLPGQVTVFNAVLDRVTLVTGWRHASAAMQVVPAWWAVTLAERGSRGALRFITLRHGLRNPAPDPNALVGLLWKDEVLALLRCLGRERTPSRVRRAMLYRELVAATPNYSALRAVVCSGLKQRANWRLGESLE